MDEETENLKECAICLEPVKVRGLLNSCPHVFCYDCLQKWSASSNQCPYCRERFSKISRIRIAGTPTPRKRKKAKKEERVGKRSYHHDVPDTEYYGHEEMWGNRMVEQEVVFVVETDEDDLSRMYESGIDPDWTDPMVDGAHSLEIQRRSQRVQTNVGRREFRGREAVRNQAHVPEFESEDSDVLDHDSDSDVLDHDSDSDNELIHSTLETRLRSRSPAENIARQNDVTHNEVHVFDISSDEEDEPEIQLSLWERLRDRRR